MTKPKHIKGPFLVRRIGDEAYIERVDGGFLCDMQRSEGLAFPSQGRKCVAEIDADAEYVVDVLNSHPHLLHACKEVLHILNNPEVSKALKKAYEGRSLSIMTTMLDIAIKSVKEQQ